MANWEKCRQKAEEVLDRYELTQPLVDVFSIAQGEEIEVTYFRPQNETDKNISGFFHKDKNTGVKKIYINMEDSSQRQVYTIAHELGHYFLDHQPNEYSVLLRQAAYATQKDNIEKEADAFAAELLMPKKMLDSVKDEYRLNDNDDFILSQLFGVSQQAMRNRINNLAKYN